MTQPDTAFDRLALILRDDFQIPADAIVPDAHLRVDLGLDSLSLTDLAFLVQRDFGFKAEADELRGVTTVAALAALCTTKLTLATREQTGG